MTREKEVTKQKEDAKKDTGLTKINIIVTTYIWYGFYGRLKWFHHFF